MNRKEKQDQNRLAANCQLASVDGWNLYQLHKNKIETYNLAKATKKLVLKTAKITLFALAEKSKIIIPLNSF